MTWTSSTISRVIMWRCAIFKLPQRPFLPRKSVNDSDSKNANETDVLFDVRCTAPSFQSHYTPQALSRGASSAVNRRAAQVPKHYEVKARQPESDAHSNGASSDPGGTGAGWPGAAGPSSAVLKLRDVGVWVVWCPFFWILRFSPQVMGHGSQHSSCHGGLET